MRIRNFKQADIPALAYLQEIDGQNFTQDLTQNDFQSYVESDAYGNIFVITDDDDDLNTWGQAGTLEGLEGEIVGYTLLTLMQDESGYHFVCHGTVQSQQRNRGAGRLLLVGALNRARLLAADFEFEAEQAGIPIYFEALLPVRDTVTSRLTEKCELQVVEGETRNGMQLYRRELW